MVTEQQSIRQETNRHNQLLLCYLRAIALCGQSIVILAVHFLLNIHLPLLPMFLINAGLLAVNGIFYHRYRTGEPISDSELLLQLILDVVAFSGLLYLSGGASNPFVSLYLIQVVIGAIMLRARHTWLLVAVTLGCYVYLSFYSIEIPHLHHYHIGDFFNLHIHGMLVSYALSAVLAAYFIIRVARNLAARDQALVRLRERRLMEENILRLGLLAANAAHELGTPLATIAVLGGAYKENATSPEEKKRADTLNSQIKRCKDILSEITNAAGAARAEAGKPEALDLFLTGLAESWHASHPDIGFHSHIASAPSPMIVGEYALKQAIWNLLDNAAEASPSYVEMRADWNKDTLIIHIRDEGPGLSEYVLKALGQPGITTKPDGMGMGLFLSHAVIARLEGTLRLEEENAKGTCFVMELPLKGILA